MGSEYLEDKQIEIEEKFKDCKWIFCEEKYKRDGTVDKKYKVLPMELSEFLKSNLDYLFVRGSADEQSLTYVYYNGYYKYISDDELKGYIKSFIPYQLRKSRDINEVFQDLKTELKFKNYEELNTNEDIINFQDGIYNIRTGELTEHSPNIFCTIQIPAKYNEIKNCDMKAPNFMKYINTLCNDDNETIQLLLQCFGLAISNIHAYRTKKALFLVGKGNTGKSQLKKLAEYLVGKENVSNIDLKKVNDTFGTSSLYQKRLAGCNDMSYQRIEDMSIFKQITGGDTIDITFKFKNTFSFLYKGFLWFNCNKLPLFGGDTGKWVYDRIMPVYCNNVIPKEKQDPKLFEKMLTEKNAIIGMALASLKKLLDNNFKFVEPQKIIEEREKYEIDNNTLLTFIKEYCEIDNNISVLKKVRRSVFKEAYDKYIKINNNNRGKITSTNMNLLLEEHFKETYFLYCGIWYMDKIKLKRSAYDEFDILYDGKD